MKTAIIYPYSIKHLGLLSDIEKDGDYLLCYYDLNPCHNPISRLVRGLSLRMNFMKWHWYEYAQILDDPEVSIVLIFATAMINVDIDFLMECKKKGLKTVLYYIDSVDASSPMLLASKENISKFKFDYTLSFDKKDCKKYGYSFSGFNYYSKHYVLKKTFQLTDLYFVGGVKVDDIRL